MSLKRKQTLMRQKEYFETKLKDRRALLSGKGVEAAAANKDTIVRRLEADLRAVNRRLRVIAGHEKRTEELAKIKADRAAAPAKEEEAAKAEKPKKAPDQAKEKKPKAEKKPAGEKAPEAVKPQKSAEHHADTKAAPKKKPEAPTA